MAEKQIILITGGSSGLGLEIVKTLLSESTAYNILIGSRNVRAGEEAVAAVKQEFPMNRSMVMAVEIDVTSDDSIQAAVELATTTYGKLDILVNNAGVNVDRDMQAGNYSLRDGWNTTWAVNVTGAHVVTTLFVPLLLKSSDPRLIFITSGTSSLIDTERMDAQYAMINGHPPMGWPKPHIINPTEAYRSSKAGLNMMMRQWYRILKHDGVKVFGVSPGFLATNLAGIGAEQLKKMGALEPSVGAAFVKDVIQGKRDKHVGKAIRATEVQPW